MKNEFKIRRLLGDDFHLNVELEENGETKWCLYRHYEDKELYYDKNNRPIMTSADSTEKDLLKYARKNHKYNENLVYGLKDVYMAFAIMILVIIRVFDFNNDILYGAQIGSTIYLWVDLIHNHIIVSRNQKVTKRMLDDKFRLHAERFFDDLFREEKEKENEE